MKISIEANTKKGPLPDLVVTFVNNEDFIRQRGQPDAKLRQKLQREIGEHVLESLSSRKFEAKHGQTAFFSAVRGKHTPDVLVIGIEHSKNDSTRERLDRLRNLGALVVSQAESLSCKRIEVALEQIWIGGDQPLEAFWEGLVLSHYQFRRYKTDPKWSAQTLRQITLVSSRKPAPGFSARIQSICASVMFARDLINTPANDLRPSQLATICKDVARESNFSVEIFDTTTLTKMGAGGILCVGLGSNDQVYLAKISCKPEGIKPKKRIALVGKAITFDSGGLVIKSSMETMKCDMSGGATVLASMRALAHLKLPLEVTAYIPIAENMINGQAMRPGDIFSLLCGKTVEVLNTDAEGRLVLADALTLASRAKPDAIIDLATLTGACAAALGSKYAGLFCNNAELAEIIKQAADISGEPIWQLPLAREYHNLIYSDIADYKNLFKDARAITAALFLEEFVDEIPWAHLDIAGPAFSATSAGVITSGGVGFGVRTLIRMLELFAADDNQLPDDSPS